MTGGWPLLRTRRDYRTVNWATNVVDDNYTATGRSQNNAVFSLFFSKGIAELVGNKVSNTHKFCCWKYTKGILVVPVALRVFRVCSHCVRRLSPSRVETLKPGGGTSPRHDLLLRLLLLLLLEAVRPPSQTTRTSTDIERAETAVYKLGNEACW